MRVARCARKRRGSKMTDLAEKAYKQRDYLTVVAQAIALQFTQPKVYDLSIPDAYNVKSLFKISCDVLSGKKINKKDVNCISTSHQFNPLTQDDLKLMKKNYGNCAEDIWLTQYQQYRDSTSVMQDVLHHDDIFRHEWFYGAGDWYEFRTGLREKLTNEIKLKKELQEAIRDFCGKFQPYIGITNSAATIDG